MISSLILACTLLVAPPDDTVLKASYKTPDGKQGLVDIKVPQELVDELKQLKELIKLIQWWDGARTGCSYTAIGSIILYLFLWKLKEK